MRTLSAYKQQYSRAKTCKGRESAFNKAMRNLSESDAKKFYSWQVAQMNMTYNKQHQIGYAN